MDEAAKRALIAEVLRLHAIGRLALIDVSGDAPRNLDGAASAVCEILIVTCIQKAEG